MSIILHDDAEPIQPAKPNSSHGDLLTIALIVLLAAAVAYMLYIKSKEQ